MTRELPAGSGRKTISGHFKCVRTPMFIAFLPNNVLLYIWHDMKYCFHTCHYCTCGLCFRSVHLLHIFPFWTPHFLILTPHFGWTPRLNYSRLWSFVEYCHRVCKPRSPTIASINHIRMYCAITRIHIDAADVISIWRRRTCYVRRSDIVARALILRSCTRAFERRPQADMAWDRLTSYITAHPLSVYSHAVNILLLRRLLKSCKQRPLTQARRCVLTDFRKTSPMKLWTFLTRRF